MHKNKTEETAADHLEFNEMFRRNPAGNILPGVQEMGYSERSSESDGMAIGDREV